MGLLQDEAASKALKLNIINTSGHKASLGEEGCNAAPQRGQQKRQRESRIDMVGFIHNCTITI